MSNDTVNSLLVHNKSKFILPLTTSVQDHIDVSDSEGFISRIVKFALTYNVVFENVVELAKLDKNTLDRVFTELVTILEQSQKDGWIFRGNFSTSERLEPYTTEDYLAIFAQYSLTYGWSDLYSAFFKTDAKSVMEQYFKADSANRTVRDMLKSDTYVKSARKITLYPNTYVDELLTEIITANVPLNAYQQSMLGAVNQQYLANFVATATNLDIPIGETKAIVLKVVLAECNPQAAAQVFSRYIYRPSDVVQYFAVPFLAAGEQVNTVILKKVRMDVNKTARKMFMSILNNIGINKGRAFLCEDMFRHFDFWKRLDKHLRWHKDSIMRRRYPAYMEAMDLLYLNDRGWTFNGRYSNFVWDGDFFNAAVVSIEQPGFFMRNIINLMRMSETGAAMPVKEVVKDIYTRSASTTTTDEKKVQKVVTRGASDFFLNDPRFVELVKNIPLKHLVQLMGILRDKALLTSPVYKRVTNRVPVSYSVPIPGVPENVWLRVLDVVYATFKNKLKAVYDRDGFIYVDDTAEKYAYSSSGRRSIDTAYSGEMLTPGSYVNIDDLNVGGDKILRLGVIWRGENSIDIDHSVIFNSNNGKDTRTCYYGNPELFIDNRLVAVSSGDITSCSSKSFSCEFIDIDMDACKASGVDSIMSTIHNYNRGPISAVECYTFVKVINRTDRVSSRTSNVSIDLADADYACGVSQSTSAASGFFILLNSTSELLKDGSVYAINDSLIDKETFQVNPESYLNEVSNIGRFLNARMSVYDVLTHREVTSSTPCSVVVSANAEKYVDVDVTVLHPSKDYDKIMARVFNS